MPEKEVKTIKSSLVCSAYTGIGMFFMGATVFSRAAGSLTDGKALAVRLAMGIFIGLIGLMVGAFLSRKWSVGTLLTGLAMAVGSIAGVISAHIDTRNIQPEPSPQAQTPHLSDKPDVPAGWVTHSVPEYGITISTPPEWINEKPQPGAVWQVGYESPDGVLVSVSAKVSTDASFAIIGVDGFLAAADEAQYLKSAGVLYENARINSFVKDFPFGEYKSLHVFYSGEISGVRIAIIAVQTVIGNKLYTFNLETLAVNYGGMQQQFYKVLDTVRLNPA